MTLEILRVAKYGCGNEEDQIAREKVNPILFPV